MNEYIDLELLKLRAEVLSAAMKSSLDEFYVRREFLTLTEDLREAWCLATNREEE
jgi:hypothetical protein